MRAIEFIIEGYPEALAEFGREADTSEVRAVIDQYRQLVNKNQFKDPREKNIDYWRKQGWTAFSQMVKLKSSDITDTQRKRGKTVGNAIILQDDAEWTVVIPLDKEASVHYGKGTEWCTTKPTQSYFEDYFYQDNITLIYAIPKDKQSNKRVAISSEPYYETRMFDQSDEDITAEQYTQISGLDPNKFIEMSLQQDNRDKIKLARDTYDTLCDEVTHLLSESPLNADAIERALKITRKQEDCYNYIIEYGTEQGKRITVHPVILVSAAGYVDLSNPRSIELGQHIDFNGITSSVFNTLLRSTPTILVKNIDQLSNEQLPLFAKTPKAAYMYAAEVLGKKPFPAGEKAIATSATWSCQYAQLLGKRFLAGEPVIAQDADAAYWYAIMLKEPFPLGEKAIAKRDVTACNYAIMALGKKPFPAGEPAIAKSAKYSFEYANEVLGKPFPAGEAAIATDAYYSVAYAQMIGKSFPAGEAAIVKDITYRRAYQDKIVNVYGSDTWASYFINDASTAYKYAQLTNKKFPEGEKAIATDAELSYYYAIKILEGKPFPEGEKAIATNPKYAFAYTRDVIKKEWPKGEPAIATNADYSFVYAISITKKPFPLGEPVIAKSKLAQQYNEKFGTNLSQQYHKY